MLRSVLESALDGAKVTRIVELGAGDGGVMLWLARRLAKRWPRVEVVMVDRHDIVSLQTHEEFSALGWCLRIAEVDVFEWLAAPGEPIDAIVCNLFLHHFTNDRIPGLLEAAASRTGVFAATEPRRARVPRAFSQLAGCIGCNRVTRHDIVVSVEAGFAARELSALWPAGAAWDLEERAAGLFTHVFLAKRRASGARTPTNAAHDFPHLDGNPGHGR